MNPRDGFVLNTPTATLGLGASLSLFVENPAGSKVNIIIERYRIPNAGTAFLACTFFSDFTKPTGTTAINPASFRIGANPPVFNVVSYYKSSAANGTGSQVNIPLQGGNNNDIESAPVIIEPGYKFALQVDATISAAVSIQLYGREVPNNL